MVRFNILLNKKRELIALFSGGPDGTQNDVFSQIPIS